MRNLPSINALFRMNSPAKIVGISPGKIESLRIAAEKQLSPEEYTKFVSLLRDLAVYGVTPWINRELGVLMAKVQWEIEVEESPEWIEALQACDRAFLGSDLKVMCYDYGMSISHKKQMCRKLYNARCPEVVEIMQPYLEEIET